MEWSGGVMEYWRGGDCTAGTRRAQSWKTARAKHGLTFLLRLCGALPLRRILLQRKADLTGNLRRSASNRVMEQGEKGREPFEIYEGALPKDMKTQQ